MTMPTRPQTVSWRLLGYHATYIELFSDLLLAKAKGHNFKATELLEHFKKEFGKFEIEIERYYDHANTFYAMGDYVRDTRSLIILE